MSRSVGDFTGGKFLNFLLGFDALLPHLVMTVKVFAKFSHDLVHDCSIVEDCEVEFVLSGYILQFAENSGFPYPGIPVTTTVRDSAYSPKNPLAAG